MYLVNSDHNISILRTDRSEVSGLVSPSIAQTSLSFGVKKREASYFSSLTNAWFCLGPSQGNIPLIEGTEQKLAIAGIAAPIEVSSKPHPPSDILLLPQAPYRITHRNLEASSPWPSDCTNPTTLLERQA
jgi:hypothetical protein